MVDYLQRAKFFRTKKRLGQNFLINPDVIGDIIDFANITKDGKIVEDAQLRVKFFMPEMPGMAYMEHDAEGT